MQILYFYYPETANLSLEEIDSLFMVKGKAAHDHSHGSSSGSSSEKITTTSTTQAWERERSGIPLSPL